MEVACDVFALSLVAPLQDTSADNDAVFLLSWGELHLKPSQLTDHMMTFNTISNEREALQMRSCLKDLQKEKSWGEAYKWGAEGSMKQSKRDILTWFFSPSDFNLNVSLLVLADQHWLCWIATFSLYPTSLRTLLAKQFQEYS